MAKVKDLTFPKTHGKLNKKADTIYRVRDGKQQSYTASENSVPPSKAQNAHRKHFGKVTAIVNAIVADPVQNAEWDQKRIAYNKHLTETHDWKTKKYKTVRSFAHFVISTQLEKAQKRRKNPISKALPKGFKLHIKPFAKLSTTELYEIIKSRFNVFYLEQHISYPDLDDIDYSATHFALFHKGHVLAYARFIPCTMPDEAVIGRLLTTERNKGYGKYIMQQIEFYAQTQGFQNLMLHAQAQTVPFYNALGYSPEGDIFQEAGIPHMLMKKSLA
jgi:ElaA protein